MKEQITAKVYAKSFAQIAKDNNVDIAQELTNLTEVINSSNDLENVLFLDVFTNEEKLAVLNDIAEKIKLSKPVLEGVKFLIEEKRIGILPLIFKEVIVLDDENKGFLRGTIEGADDSIDENQKNKLVAEIKKYMTGKDMVFDYAKNESLTAGYRVKINDVQLDATVDNQFSKFKHSVLSE
ncbi:MAG: F0F1 ATP synthase subunit delta [Bacteriovoracaceae bacterium]|jgi:F-type H+-transporting ATPase subunit delta|nr:F0F1 ATP synthase subunit delta [Bacteriovoracaceae bacterium]